MITWAIAFVFGIAAIACAGNGEWGPFAIAVVIILLVLALGAASREGDRAYNNAVRFWAHGELPKEERRTVRRVEKRKEPGRSSLTAEQQEMYDREMARIRENEENMTKKYWEKMTCPKCRTNMFMERTVIRAGGAEIWQIKCPACRETTQIRVK